MRLALKRANIALAISAFVFGIAFGWLAKPLYKTSLMIFWQNEFAKLTFNCDQAMRNHYISKQNVFLDPNKNNVDELKSAEIALIDCQDYDILQKRLIKWGLTENEVGEMVLHSAERQANTLRKVIQIHEIEY